MVGPRPAAPTIPLRTRSAPEPAISSRIPSSPASTRPSQARARRLGRVRVGERDRGHAVLARLLEHAAPSSTPAASPTTCSSSEAATISSAWVPIEPVDPRITTFFIDDRG